MIYAKGMLVVLIGYQGAVVTQVGGQHWGIQHPITSSSHDYLCVLMDDLTSLVETVHDPAGHAHIRLRVGVLSPDIQHQFVAAQRHAGVNTVARGEDIASARHAIFKGVPGRGNHLLIRAGIQQTAVDVSDQADLVPVTPFDLGNIDTRLGIQ